MIVTGVPPAAGPLFGLRPVTVGAAATAATVSVKDWVAELTLLVAVNVSG